MNFNMLKYVVTVAEERSFTRAAKRLYVSQPSLSQGIQTLESRLGVQLFDRKTTPLSLTDAGRLYVDWAKNVLLTQAQLDRQLASVSEEQRKKLAIGVLLHRATTFLPEPVRQFLERYPDCDVRIEESADPALYDQLGRGDLDLVIGPPHADVDRFSNMLVMTERLLLAAPASYGIQGEESLDAPYPSVPLSDLADKPFITLNPEPLVGWSIRALCERDNFLPLYGMECTHVETAHALVASGLGVTVLPELLVRADPQPDVEYFTIAKSNPTRDMALVYRSTGYLSDHAKDFAELFLSLYRERQRVGRLPKK